MNWEDFIANPQNPNINYTEISGNPNVTINFISNNLHLPWDWKVLSAHPNITMEIINNHPDYPWDRRSFLLNPDFTWDKVIKKEVGELYPLFPEKHANFEPIIDRPWTYAITVEGFNVSWELKLVIPGKNDNN